MDSYADVDQLKTWLGLADDQPDPTNGVIKLRSATILVARAANLNPYDPVTASNVQPLQDATCAQAATWLTLGIEPGALGLDTAPVKKSSILGDSVERDTTGQVDKLESAATSLCEESREILLGAGLLWQALPTGDAAPYLYDYGLGGYPPSGYWWGSEPCLWP